MAQKYFKANLRKLEDLRVARGWSREELADKAIVSTRTIDSLMAGKQAVLSTFSKLAKALETPVQTIVEGIATPSKPRARTWRVTIDISTPYDEFDEAGDLPELLRQLMKRLGGAELWEPEATAGSTKLTFYLTEKQHSKLMAAFEAGSLSDLKIVGVDAKKYLHRALNEYQRYMSKHRFSLYSRGEWGKEDTSGESKIG